MKVDDNKKPKIKQRADEEERRRKAESEERRQAEAERRRQEAEDRRRLAEAEAETRRQDWERQRLEEEAKVAAKEAQRETQLEQEPRQSAEQWLLPLIGAGAASLPILLFLAWMVAQHGWPPANIVFFVMTFVMTQALYGSATGMLIRRFGIPKAVAIPIIPFLFLAFFVNEGIVFVGYLMILLWSAAAIVCTWLAFWLHSRWARKQRLRDAGMVPKHEDVARAG